VTDYATSLVAQLERATEAVKDEIAKDGLMALKRVLDEAGLPRKPLLKDYEVYSHVGAEGIIFEILLQLHAVDVDVKKVEEAAARAAQGFEDAADRTYQVIARGGFNRVARMKDKRRPIPSAINRPKRTNNNLRQWGPNSSKYGPRSAFKGPNERKTDHALSMSAPRDMHVNREGRLSVTFERQTRVTKSGDIHFPQGKFQGIMKKFMDELRQVVSEKFAPEIEKILKNYIST
jgi:hypothetical protein